MIDKTKEIIDIKNKIIENLQLTNVKRVIIMGSGWGKILAEKYPGIDSVDYHKIGLKKSRVKGHSDRLYYIKNKKTLIFGGRFHYYTGISIETSVLPVKIASLFFPEQLIITNASGALSPHIQPGDIVIIKDQINFCKKIITPKFRFNKIYQTSYITEISNQMKKMNIPHHLGIYGGLSGPAYETVSEGSFYYSMGADILGMSTVAEAEQASIYNIPTIGLSLATNKIPIKKEEIIPVNHEEVLETAKMNLPKILDLLTNLG